MYAQLEVKLHLVALETERQSRDKRWLIWTCNQTIWEVIDCIVGGDTRSQTFVQIYSVLIVLTADSDIYKYGTFGSELYISRRVHIITNWVITIYLLRCVVFILNASVVCCTNTNNSWRLGVLVSVVGRINKVNHHRARLVHDGWPLCG